MNHPTHHLPPEIISDIFIDCLTRHSPRPNQAPLNISSVCKLWREIATSTPRLWSQISIQQNGGFPDAALDAILHVLMEKCEAWRNVQLTIQPSTILKILSVIPSRTPNIQKITIQGVDTYDTFSVTRLFTAPLASLTHLTIESHTRFSPCSHGFVLENLLSLKLRYVNQSDLIECLSRCPRLEEVKAWFFFSSRKSQPIHDHVKVCLPHLHTLRLTLDVLMWDEGKRGPFEHFLFPALKTFNLYIVTGHLDNANTMHRLWDLSIDFACQYATSLQNLEIDGQFITSPPSFLGRLPKLTHLGLPIKLLNDEFIHELVRRFSSSVQQPCQGFFQIESLFVFAFKTKTLRAIIDHAVKEASSTAFHPVIIIVPDGLLDSFILPPGCMVEIMGRGDWKERRREDLYREIGWEYFRG